MKKWRFVAVDVDGTLLDDNDHYDIACFNAVVRQLAQQGVDLIVASGNSLDALQTIFADSPLVKNFVAENGGRIISNGYEQFSKSHDRAIIAQLLAWERTLQPQPDLLSLSGASQTFISDQFKDVAVPGTIPCQVDTYKNENTIFLIRQNRGNIPPRFGHFF